MRPTSSRTITSLLAAVGAGFAVSAMIGAPAAIAQPGTIDCLDGQIVIDGQCNVPQVDPNNVVAPVNMPNGSGPAMGDRGMGDPGMHGTGTGTDPRLYPPGSLKQALPVSACHPSRMDGPISATPCRTGVHAGWCAPCHTAVTLRSNLGTHLVGGVP
jgi:hypothetical protein